jgi:ABC-2 type transport system ATP-binding protein
VEAVRGISFSVEAGETFGLLGPNGAGKSTTLGCITSLVRPTSGRVVVDGVDAQRDPLATKRLIAVVPQTRNLDRDLSVREVLTYHGRYFGLPAAERERRADRLLEEMQLQDKAEAKPLTLSGGMQQRAMIARALMHDPRLLLLDEPTTGLDPQARRALWQTLHALQERGLTIILTTHYMEEADRLCQRVAIMDHGKILALDTPAALKQSIGADTVVTVKATGDTGRLAELLAREVEGVTRTRRLDGGVELHVQGGDRLVPRIVMAAERGGFDLADLSVSEPSLETVFINLTGKELRD